MVISLQDRARGAFMGLAVGDALGSPTEGKTPEYIKERWGRVTDFLTEEQGGSDDTEYALFSSKLLLEHKELLTADIVADAYRRDIVNAENSYKGAGFSEIIAITNLSRGLQPPASGMHLHSWSDGLAMRVAPYGIGCAGNPQLAARLANEDGIVANSGEGVYAGQAVAAAVAVAMTGADLDKIVQAAMSVVPENSWTSSAIRRGAAIGAASTDVWSSLPQLHKSLVCSYYFWPDVAPEAVGLAFGIIASARGKFEDAVAGAVNIGRDTDTIAAIAGTVCGALQGIQIIPEHWTNRIAISPGKCIKTVRGMHIITVADELAQLAQSWSKSK